MAYLQAIQLGIHGEDVWWQLFDLVTNKYLQKEYTLNLMSILS